MSPKHSPPSHDAPDAAPPAGHHRRLARLFGESLFGAWLDPAQLMAAGDRRRRKRGRLGRRLGIVLLLVVLVGAGAWLTRQGLARRAEQERARVAKDVAAFLAEGELERLAQFLALLAPTSRPLAPTDPYLDTILQAEAALFRYHDAGPARLARVAQHTAGDALRPPGWLARLTVAPRGDRLVRYDQLAAMAADVAKDPEYHTLMAQVQEARGEPTAARQSWERSAQTGPLWLPHRYLQCAFEARRKNPEAVARLLQHMARVAPASPWTQLALLHFSATSSPPPPAPPPAAPPVLVYQAESAAALVAVGAGDSRAARQALERSFAAVDNQAAFVLDTFDLLVDAKAEALASELAEFEAWPRGNPDAQARLEALAARRARVLEAPPPTPSLAAAVTAPAERTGAPVRTKPARAKSAKAKAVGKKTKGKRRR